jgi:putative transposase
VATCAYARTSATGTYLVTAGTYLKKHHFRTPAFLDWLQDELLSVAHEFGWELETWAVFSNHYHFVGHSPSSCDVATSLSNMLAALHRRTSGPINQVENRSAQKVWYNFWDTKLTYHKSYLARLNYVHQNPVKHGLVPVANQYPWCSARWFEELLHQRPYDRYIDLRSTQ